MQLHINCKPTIIITLESKHYQARTRPSPS